MTLLNLHHFSVALFDFQCDHWWPYRHQILLLNPRRHYGQQEWARHERDS